jgi:hypothetical protein
MSGYAQAARLANEATAEVVARYIHNAMIEREERQEENVLREERVFLLLLGIGFRKGSSFLIKSMPGSAYRADRVNVAHYTKPYAWEPIHQILHISSPLRISQLD